MSEQSYIRFFLGFILFLSVSCNFETQTQKESYKSAANSQEDLDFDKYKRILRKTCMVIEGCEFEFEPDNTRFFLLSDSDQDTCFVAESSIQCGCPGGSCGNEIQVIKKDKKGVNVLLSLCGSTVEPTDTFEHHYRSFSYYLRGYQSKQMKIRVSYSQKEFHFDTLKKGNLDYRLLQVLLKDNAECLPDFDCVLADKITLDSLVTNNQGGFLWKVTLPPSNKPETTYLLSTDGNYKIINTFESALSFKPLAESSKGYFDIEIETLFKLQTWKWTGKKYEKKKEVPIKF